MLGTLTSIWNRVFAVLSRFSMYRVAFVSLATLAGVAFVLSFFSLMGYCYKLVQLRNQEIDRRHPTDARWYHAA